MKNENKNLKKIRTNDISNEKRPIVDVTKSRNQVLNEKQNDKK